MKDLFKLFQNNIYTKKYEYIELYQQSGYTNYLSGSSKGDIKEASLNIEGMSLRILSNNARKMISTSEVGEKTLQNLFYVLRHYDRPINLRQNIFNKLNENISCDYLREIYFNINKLFEKYAVQYSINMEKTNVSKCIYKKYEFDVILKHNTQIYLSIIYYIGEKRYTFFDVVLDKSYNIILRRLEENILNYISSSESKVICSGKYNIILASGESSILFHECCGHLFESSKTNSPFYSCNKSKMLANPKLTVIDDIFHLGNKELYDDEGNKKSKTYIIKEGKFENLLSDKYTSYQSNSLKPTGNCRRESYLNFPEPRMYCTYVKKGNDSVEKIFDSVKDGIFIKSLGEARINHKSGNFESVIEEGYIIKKGKIREQIYGIKIKDNASSFLQNIKYVSNDLKIVPGMCNSNSGLLYVEYGSPTIGVKNVTLEC